tara:strand:- start:68 stop:394 length:327 start_codon:yes stop_codon:yes gene_type:complete
LSILIDTTLKRQKQRKPKEKTREIKLGTKYRAKTFAGPMTTIRATRKDPDSLGFFGQMNKRDMLKMIDAGIPYDLDKDLNRHEVFVFFDQVEEIKPAAHHKKKRNIIK